MNPPAPGETVSARQLAYLVVDALGFEGTDPAQMDLTTTLFGDGLGLDSLDLLEISLVIQQRYGVKLRANDPKNEAIFASLQSLADHIAAAQAVRAKFVGRAA